MARCKQTVQIRMLNSGKNLFLTRRMFKEMKFLQTRTHMLIPKKPFSLVIKEIMMDVGPADLRVRLEALKALQEACEMYMIQFFEDAYGCTLHAKRVTLMVPDMHLVRRIRGRQDIINH